MKSKKRLTIIAIGILFIVIFINLWKKDLWDVNAELFKEELLSLEQSVETINLLDLAPFEWDEVYSFAPYTTEDMIYETVGYKWDNISATVSEGMNQIVFLNAGKVVGYIYGYPANNGYGISLASENDTEFVSILNVNDDLNFQVTRREDVIYLSNY